MNPVEVASYVVARTCLDPEARYTPGYGLDVEAIETGLLTAIVRPEVWIAVVGACVLRPGDLRARSLRAWIRLSEGRINVLVESVEVTRASGRDRLVTVPRAPRVAGRRIYSGEVASV